MRDSFFVSGPAFCFFASGLAAADRAGATRSIALARSRLIRVTTLPCRYQIPSRFSQASSALIAAPLFSRITTGPRPFPPPAETGLEGKRTGIEGFAVGSGGVRSGDADGSGRGSSARAGEGSSCGVAGCGAIARATD